MPNNPSFDEKGNASLHFSLITSRVALGTVDLTKATVKIVEQSTGANPGAEAEFFVEVAVPAKKKTIEAASSFSFAPAAPVEEVKSGKLVEPV